MKNETLSQICFYLSILAVVLAGVGAFLSTDLWLASTQWVLVGAVLAIWAVYLR